MTIKPGFRPTLLSRSWTSTLSRMALETVKYVLRGLPTHITSPELSSALASQDVTPISLRQMTKTVYNPSTQARQTSPIPLWVVTISKSAASVASLKSITGLLHFRVHIEDYRGRTSVQQCYRCQKFGHKANFCSMRPRCAKCAEDHNTRDCPHPQPVIDSPKCANCGGAHQANSDVCPTLLKFRKSQQPRPRPPGFAPTPAGFPPLASALSLSPLLRQLRFSRRSLARI